MALQNQTALIESSQDPRGRVRRKLQLQVDVSTPVSEAAQTVVHNLSETGLLIETTAMLAIGEVIEVDLPREGLRSAAVVWSSDQLFGCRFIGDLSPGGVSAALLRATFEVPGTHDKVQTFSAPEAEPPNDNLSLRARLGTITGLALLSWAILAGVIAWLLA